MKLKITISYVVDTNETPGEENLQKLVGQKIDDCMIKNDIISVLYDNFSDVYNSPTDDPNEAEHYLDNVVVTVEELKDDNSKDPS